MFMKIKEKPDYSVRRLKSAVIPVNWILTTQNKCAREEGTGIFKDRFLDEPGTSYLFSLGFNALPILLDSDFIFFFYQLMKFGAPL